ASEPADWPHTDLWRRAAAIPGVKVLTDVDGRAAARFGAVTSGQALLFDTAGRLLFSGGITGARGHQGDNAGRRAVVARVFGRETAPAHTPVFGCSLVNESNDSKAQ
ncbi:MAG TPA: hypothetical protein VM029_15690, partial [Opitutaceae bacterium]|nr:hypothetical protein [Opitutaceae bacterium]